MSQNLTLSWPQIMSAVSVIGGLAIASVGALVTATWRVALKLNELSSRIDKGANELGTRLDKSINELSGNVTALSIRIEGVDKRLCRIDDYVDDLRQSVPVRRARKIVSR